MAYYLFVARGQGAIINADLLETSTDWADMEREFLRAARIRDFDAYVDSYRLYSDQFTDNVFWSEELAGPAGISVRAIPLPDAEPGAAGEVIRHLRNTRDVVRSSVVRIRQWVPVSRLRFSSDPVAVAAEIRRKIDAEEK